MTVQFNDDDFQFGLEVALGYTYRQAARRGRVLATARRIKDGDADSWVQQWTAMADAAWTAALAASKPGLHVPRIDSAAIAGDLYEARVKRSRSNADSASRRISAKAR